MSQQDVKIRLIPPRNKIGTFANAVTVLQEGGGEECLLDFGVFSLQAKQLNIVSRIRIHKSFLPHLRRRIDDLIREQEAAVKAQETTTIMGQTPSKMVN